MNVKQSFRVLAGYGTSTLAAMSRASRPLERRWVAASDARLDRRTPAAQLKLTQAKRAHASSRSAASKARRTVRAIRKDRGRLNVEWLRERRTLHLYRGYARHTAKELSAARKGYPPKLETAAVALYVAVGVILYVPWRLTGSPILMTALAGLLAAAAANVALIYSASRHEVMPDGLSQNERTVWRRLQPRTWGRHAAGRGLGGTSTSKPELTPGGLRVVVGLGEKWTPDRLARHVGNIRALAMIDSSVAVRVSPGEAGGTAILEIATRSAADGMPPWSPAVNAAGKASLGVDCSTGRDVSISLSERVLVSGTSGSGKSWALRPLMAAALDVGDVVLIDGKGEEATAWRGVVRTAVTPEAIRHVINQVHAEMTARAGQTSADGLSVWSGRQLTLVVDEGQVVLSLVKADKKLSQKLVEISSLGRSRGVVLWWATQYPVVSGPNPGVDRLIAANLVTRLSLRVASRQHAQVALDDCVDYAPQDIPEGHVGHAYLKGHGPSMIRLWPLDDDAVKRLAHGPQWIGPELQSPEPASLQAHRVRRQTNRDHVLQAIIDGSVSQAEVARSTGLNVGTVSKQVASLIAEGQVTRDGRRLSIVASGGQ